MKQEVCSFGTVLQSVAGDELCGCLSLPSLYVLLGSWVQLCPDVGALGWTLISQT